MLLFTLPVCFACLLCLLARSLRFRLIDCFTVLAPLLRLLACWLYCARFACLLCLVLCLLALLALHALLALPALLACLVASMCSLALGACLVASLCSLALGACFVLVCLLAFPCLRCLLLLMAGLHGMVAEFCMTKKYDQHTQSQQKKDHIMFILNSHRSSVVSHHCQSYIFLGTSSGFF
jgi:hypothetical protein